MIPPSSLSIPHPMQEAGTSTTEGMPEAAPVFELLDYQKAKPRIDALITSWSQIKDIASKKRKERRIELDVEAARKRGDLEADATLIPVRVIEGNITREKADAMQFLNASQRLCYFRCVDDPTVDARQLDTEVTKGWTYPGWYKAFDRHYDGCAMHGWDVIEVLYDASKPLRVAFEHRGHDRVLFNIKVDDIQNSELVLCEYEVTGMTLETFVTDFAFDQVQVDELLKVIKDAEKDNQVVKIYKGYFKYQKCVYLFWYAKEGNVSSWLKAPEKLRCGILKKNPLYNPAPPPIGAAIAGTPVEQQPEYIEEEVSQYPLFLYIYKEDEEPAITNHKGRAFFDLPQQEAVTALTSAFVNGTMRASSVYASPSPNQDLSEAGHKLEELVIEPNMVMPIGINFYSMPYPEPTLLQGLQFLNALNSEQNGKMAVSVKNRKDSRKTATELDIASQEENKITSVNLATYSEYLRSIFAFAWKITHSQALANTIVLLPKNMIDPVGGTTMRVNDVTTLNHLFDVRPAGEIDIVEKEKQLQAIQQDWPVFQATPLAPLLMEEYVRLQYPLHADKFIAALRQGDVGRQLVMGLSGVLQATIDEEDIAQMTPQDQANFQTLQQTAAQYLQAGVAQPAQLQEGEQQQQQAIDV